MLFIRNKLREPEFYNPPPFKHFVRDEGETPRDSLNSSSFRQKHRPRYRYMDSKSVSPEFKTITRALNHKSL